MLWLDIVSFCLQIMSYWACVGTNVSINKKQTASTTCYDELNLVTVVKNVGRMALFQCKFLFREAQMKYFISFCFHRIRHCLFLIQNIPTVNSTSNVSDLVESSPSHNFQLVGKVFGLFLCHILIIHAQSCIFIIVMHIHHRHAYSSSPCIFIIVMHIHHRHAYSSSPCIFLHARTILL